MQEMNTVFGTYRKSPVVGQTVHSKTCGGKKEMNIKLWKNKVLLDSQSAPPKSSKIIAKQRNKA